MTIGALIKVVFSNWRRRHDERKCRQAIEEFSRRLDRHTRKDILFIHDPL